MISDKESPPVCGEIREVRCEGELMGRYHVSWRSPSRHQAGSSSILSSPPVAPEQGEIWGPLPGARCGQDTQGGDPGPHLGSSSSEGDSAPSGPTASEGRRESVHPGGGQDDSPRLPAGARGPSGRSPRVSELCATPVRFSGRPRAPLLPFDAEPCARCRFDPGGPAG